jgi:hypothetical protein
MLEFNNAAGVIYDLDAKLLNEKLFYYGLHNF